MRNWGVVHTVGAEAGIDRSRVVILSQAIYSSRAPLDIKSDQNSSFIHLNHSFICSRLFKNLKGGES